MTNFKAITKFNQFLLATASCCLVNLASADVSLSPFPLAFGNVAVGSSSTLPLTLTNNGTAPLNINDFSSDGTPFFIDSGTSSCKPLQSLAAGASCIIRVAFVPDRKFSYLGSLKLTTDAPSSPDTVPMSGIGSDATTSTTAAPAVSLAPAKLDFTAQAVSASSVAQPLTLTNTGNAPLSISSIFADGDYAVSANACGATLAAGAKCAVSVSFTPTGAGTRDGKLYLYSDATGSPHSVNLSGVIDINAASATMGVVRSASGTTSSFTLKATLTVDSTDAGQPGNLYVALTAFGNLYFYDGINWSHYDGGAMPPYRSERLASQYPGISVLSGANIYGLNGANFYIGYGLNDSDMLNNQKYWLIYTVR